MDGELDNLDNLGMADELVADISYGSGEITPDEREEMMLTTRLASVSPSPADQAYMRRLSHGQSNVREQIDRGQIPPDIGQAMLGQMQARAAPMFVQAREVPILMARLNYLRLQRQMAQQEAVFQQNMAFRARTIESRMRTFGEGENAVTTIEQPDGKLLIVHGARGGRRVGAATPVSFEERQRAQIEREGRDFSRREFAAWRRDFVQREGRPPRQDETDAFMDNLEVTTREFTRRFAPPPLPPSAMGPAASVVGGAGPAGSAATPNLGEGHLGRTAEPPLQVPASLRQTTMAALDRLPFGLSGVAQRGQIQVVTQQLENLYRIRSRRPLTGPEQQRFREALNYLEDRARRPIPTRPTPAPPTGVLPSTPRPETAEVWAGGILGG